MLVKRFPWFETILIIVVMSISLYAALSDAQNLSWQWFTRDDAYYYFKVAQNISEGHGSTFDGINRTNGYHPLWMAVHVAARTAEDEIIASESIGFLGYYRDHLERCARTWSRSGT